MVLLKIFYVLYNRAEALFVKLPVNFIADVDIDHEAYGYAPHMPSPPRTVGMTGLRLSGITEDTAFTGMDTASALNTPLNTSRGSRKRRKTLLEDEKARL